MMADCRPALDAYIQLLEGLRHDNLEGLRAICHPEIQFRNPFNEKIGFAHFITALDKMFSDIQDMRFSCRNRAAMGNVGFFSWVMLYRTHKEGSDIRFEGTTELHFDTQGRVLMHIDYWDCAAQFYETLPVIGFILRHIRRRMQRQNCVSVPT